MYSIEYKCTNVEIVQTTTNITTVKESNKNTKDTLNNSEFTQEYDIIDMVSPCIHTLKNVIKTNNKVMHKKTVDRKSVVKGKRVSVRVDKGGSRIIKKKT